MSWSAAIRVDGEGPSPCGVCGHQDACHIPKVVEPIRSLLTSVDVGCEGHMAIGHADLTCDSFVAKDAAVEEPTTDSLGDTAGTGEDAGSECEPPSEFVDQGTEPTDEGASGGCEPLSDGGAE